MMLRWLIASLHLLALPLGLGAVWARHRALRAVLDADGLRRVLFADNLWGLAALLWIGTGLLRAFAIGRGASVDTTPALTLARISRIQAGLIVLIVFAAAALARGLFF